MNDLSKFPDGRQSVQTQTSSAAKEERHRRETELQEIADGAYGGGPMWRGVARDELVRMRAGSQGGFVCHICGAEN